MNNEDKEMALLVDLARLLKKHGRETFEALADSLTSPHFVEGLSNVLATVAAAAPQRRPTAKGLRDDERDRLARVALRLAEVGGQTEAALRPFVESMSSGEALPRLKDVKAFAERSGLPVPAATSRRNAIAQLVDVLMALSPQEIEALIPELESFSRSDDRSLEGWSRIIERSRAELNE